MKEEYCEFTVILNTEEAGENLWSGTIFVENKNLNLDPKSQTKYFIVYKNNDKVEKWIPVQEIRTVEPGQYDFYMCIEMTKENDDVFEYLGELTTADKINVKICWDSL